MTDQRPDLAGLGDGYALIPGILDELVAPDGSVRSSWRRFIAEFEALPADHLAARLRKAERLRAENGLAYTVSAAACGAERPWGLDFVPLLMSEEEWTGLEQGLKQRARLLDMVLADLYGPQRLLRDGVLPPALVLANPHFLRPSHGIQPLDGRHLHFYAVDLGRGPDGRWWVLSDRTQAPMGFGYALENRIVLARTMPEVFRSHQVQRLAPFFNTMNNDLVGRSRREDPRIVLLTSELDGEVAFDHAYLARYLGYVLAVGADLTVRNERVYLKTVEGLMPVDLIVRGMDAELCDPLEMDTASLQGIPGLLQAVRAGKVVVANALGSGLIEAKAMMGFLPDLSRHLLGEDLLLPNVATWWCGQDDARGHVIEHMDSLAIDDAFERRPMLKSLGHSERIPGIGLTSASEIEDRLRQEGHKYVGQELVSLSTTPVLSNGMLEPRPMALRVFLCAAGDDYALMPGGLTRVAATRDPRAALMRRGKETKDTWVLSHAPVPAFSLLRSPPGTVKAQRRGKDIPSRSADNLFWLGRYTERAEDTMRVLRTVLRRITVDTIERGDTDALEQAIAAVLDRTGIEPAREDETALGPTFALERQIREMMCKDDVPFGVLDTVGNLDRVATMVRDWLSVEAWRTLGQLNLEVREAIFSRFFNVGDALDRLERALGRLAAFSGMEMENMTRDHGWRFLDMGRRLERADHISKLLRRFLGAGDPEDDGSLMLLLEVADSVMTYRWRNLATPMVAPVLDLLLLDETNPRSLAFQLVALDDHVMKLPTTIALPERSTEQRTMLEIVAQVRLAELSKLSTADGEGRRADLLTLLDAVDVALPKLSESVTRTYFSHAEARRPADLQPGSLTT